MDGDFTATSIFGMMTGRGLVQMEFLGKRIQVSPDDARKIAANILEAAEAADSDAALVHCLTDMGMDRDCVGRLLLALRKKRAELWEETHAG